MLVLDRALVKERARILRKKAEEAQNRALQKRLAQPKIF